MEIGGLMAHAFKLFIGNADIMVVAITWIVFCTLLLTLIEINKNMEI